MYIHAYPFGLSLRNRCLRSGRKDLSCKWLFLLWVYLFLGMTTTFIAGHFCNSFWQLEIVPSLKIVPQGFYKYFSIPIDNTLQQPLSLRKSLQNNFPQYLKFIFLFEHRDYAFRTLHDILSHSSIIHLVNGKWNRESNWN